MSGQTTQWPKENGKTMIYKTQHRKLQIEKHEPHYNRGVPCVSEALVVLAPRVAPFALL